MIDKSRLPNLLTWLRIIAIPVMVLAYAYGGYWGIWAAGGLFIAASITDYFDGHLARKWGVQSSFGRLLDPIADKLLVAAALLILLQAHQAPFWPALVIICREVLVSGLREFLAERRIPMPVTALAKTKTGVQMTAISVLLLAPVVDPLLVAWFSPETTPAALCLGSFCESTWIALIGTLGLWVAAVLTFITGYHYWRAGAKHMD